MKARIAILILFALFVSGEIYSESFGPSRIVLEKTWNIRGEQGAMFSLDGTFIANTSYQKVVGLDGTRGIEFAVMPDGTIKVLYNGTLTQGSTEIKAIAIVDVDYEVVLKEDWPSDGISLPENSSVTEYDAAMEETARRLQDKGSLLATIGNVADWTNKNIQYDIGYFSKIVPAKTVFKDRRGVCVEYSHLFISFMNVLGIKTRYVSGYVLGEDWQTHAWVEVLLPDGNVLPVDPTFGQVQHLDNSHLASFFSSDQTEVLDIIQSNGEVDFDSSESIMMETSEEGGNSFGISTDFSEQEGIIQVKMENRNQEYTFATYRFNMPKDAGESEHGILLFYPGEKKTKTYSFREGYVQDGYSYSIPTIASLNDQKMKKDLIFSRNEKIVPTACAIPGALILLAAVAAMKR